MYSSWDKLLNLLPSSQQITHLLPIDAGTIKHSLQWISSSSNDMLYLNPNFKAPEKGTSVLSEKGLVVYLIHGTADYPDGFNDFIINILLKLPSYIYGICNVTFDNRFGGLSIQEQAIQIIEKIAVNGHSDVGFVGHSRGGLNAQQVDALVAEKKESDIKVHFVINICTPYKGSYLALPPLTSVSTSIGQMAINSDHLKKVAKEVMESQADYHFILARYDKVVEPDHCYVTDYVKKNPKSLIVIENEGHLGVMHNSYLASRCVTIFENLAPTLERKAGLIHAPNESPVEEEFPASELTTRSCFQTP